MGDALFWIILTLAAVVLLGGTVAGVRGRPPWPVLILILTGVATLQILGVAIDVWQFTHE